jgi:hypothetical protein
VPLSVERSFYEQFTAPVEAPHPHSNRNIVFFMQRMFPMREFKIGQYVYYVPGRADGGYVVMRLLPRGTKGGPHYIIRSQDDPLHNYTAEAQELRTATRPL